MPKLKVYATRIGFHDAVVAAPNQKAALAAWDVRENLFAQGAARVADDPATVKAALAHPGVVLRRGAGSSGSFSTAPGAPEVPKLARPKGAKSAKAAPEKAPDRSGLDAAERALSDFETAAGERRAAIERRRRDLEAEARGLERELERKRRSLERDRERERAKYERQGGR